MTKTANIAISNFSEFKAYLDAIGELATTASKLQVDLNLFGDISSELVKLALSSLNIVITKTDSGSASAVDDVVPIEFRG